MGTFGRDCYVIATASCAVSNRESRYPRHGQLCSRSCRRTCKGSQADRLLAHNHATDADICAGGRCDELHVHACSFACVCVCISASVYVFVCMRVYLCAYICAQVYNLLPGVNGEKTQGFTQGATYDTRTGVSVCLLACLSAIFCLCTWAGCVPMTQKVN